LFVGSTRTRNSPSPLLRPEPLGLGFTRFFKNGAAGQLPPRSNSVMRRRRARISVACGLVDGDHFPVLGDQPRNR
jgi:hypothetical protein